MGHTEFKFCLCENQTVHVVCFIYKVYSYTLELLCNLFFSSHFSFGTFVTCMTFLLIASFTSYFSSFFFLLFFFFNLFYVLIFFRMLSVKFVSDFKKKKRRKNRQKFSSVQFKMVYWRKPYRLNPVFWTFSAVACKSVPTIMKSPNSSCLVSNCCLSPPGILCHGVLSLMPSDEN